MSCISEYHFIKLTHLQVVLGLLCFFLLPKCKKFYDLSLVSTGLLLFVQKMASQYEWLYTEMSCEDELLLYMQWMGCSELGNFFFLNTLYPWLMISSLVVWQVGGGEEKSFTSHASPSHSGIQLSITGAKRPLQITVSIRPILAFSVHKQVFLGATGAQRANSHIIGRTYKNNEWTV